MICEKCHENTASVHVERIVDGVKTEHYLCLKCAYEMDESLSFDNLFKNFLNNVFTQGKDVKKERAADITCKRCGMTLSRFRSVGRLGCADCYESFKESLLPVIKGVQADITHRGKIPKNKRGDLLLKRRIEMLREDIKAAVQNEEYEKAASLRDKIKELEGAV